MNTEPLWKTVLNWGAVVTFFALPLIVLTLQLTGLFPSKEEAGYLKDLQRNVTVLVAALAGLRSFEQIKNGSKPKPPP